MLRQLCVNLSCELVLDNPKPTANLDACQDYGRNHLRILVRIKLAVKDLHRAHRFLRHTHARLLGRFGNIRRLLAQTRTGALVMQHRYMRVIDDVVARFVDAIAKINVLAVEKVSFVPTAQLAAQIHGHHHEGTGDDIYRMRFVKIGVALEVAVVFGVVWEQFV